MYLLRKHIVFLNTSSDLYICVTIKEKPQTLYYIDAETIYKQFFLIQSDNIIKFLSTYNQRNPT